MNTTNSVTLPKHNPGEIFDAAVFQQHLNSLESEAETMEFPEQECSIEALNYRLFRLEKRVDRLDHS